MSAVIAHIVEQHAEEAAFIWNLRQRLVVAADCDLCTLNRHDERLSAHLEGLLVAGPAGLAACRSGDGAFATGFTFAAAVIALENDDSGELDRLISSSCPHSVEWRALASAMGWVEAPVLSGKVKALIMSPVPERRLLGITACALHRLGNDSLMAQGIDDSDPRVVARSLRAAAELGCADLLPRALRALESPRADVRFWAAWAAVVLGNVDSAFNVLEKVCLSQHPLKRRALELALIALPIGKAHRLLQQLGAVDGTLALIEGSGRVGDPRYIPWLLRQMTNPDWARLAGDSFTLITGLRLSIPGFERLDHPQVVATPNDNPDDHNVAVGRAGELPWPEVSKVTAWWESHEACFTSGLRHFMGKPLNAATFRSVLANGSQGQRRIAALHLARAAPGSALFEWRAPAWRQQRLLAQM